MYPQAPPRTGALSTAQLGLWLFLATVTMLFVAFTSAYIVRQSGPDWKAVALPRTIWLNSGALVLSSLTLEAARAARRRNWNLFRQWLLLTLVLGVLFLSGQYSAWKQLAWQGIFLSTNPHSAFFYILTGTHGVHLLGGLLGLFYVLVQSWKRRSALAYREAFKAAATYWHFMGGVWLYLLLILKFL